MRTTIVVATVSVLLYPFATFAQVLPPPPPPPSVDVPDHCAVVDSDGASHQYSGGYFGICALQAAIDNGSVSGVVFSNAFPSFGLFVTTVNGVLADPSSEYWALYQNGSFASLGLSQLPVAAGDSIKLELHDFSDNPLGSSFLFTIHSLISSVPVPLGAGTGSGVTIHAPFDIPLAMNFLAASQSADGSFGSAMLDDWVAIGTSVGGWGDMREKLSAYEVSHPISTSVVTEAERRAMALEALGINPYSGTPVDYISPIVSSFDGTQIGDSSLVNDDIFAIFPLLHAGYTIHDNIIRNVIAHIIASQENDGSWVGSVDLTAAAVQALALINDEPNVAHAIKRALEYLHTKQLPDASTSEPFSTSWLLQAIGAVGGSVSEWQQVNRTPSYYLATQQERDGGIVASSTQDRIWATAYAIPGIKRATWDSLLQSFPKPTTQTATTTGATTTAPAEVITVLPDVPQREATTAETALNAPTSTDPVQSPAASSSQTAAAAGAVAGESNDALLLLPFIAFLAFAAWRWRMWSINH
jgi:hypothetical protein